METGEYGEIRCAHCGGNNTHHDKVEIWNRRNDGQTGLHVSVTGNKLMADDNVITGNPSSRRQGLSVKFWCESCLHWSELLLAQHKGMTHLSIEEGSIDPPLEMPSERAAPSDKDPNDFSFGA